ncbi:MULTISPECIES: uroporphyrinogen decarboxylase family protein [Blautia]|uniref:uroporphyrinogen decarboxylase family protein n=1 Tax=Blautia TaxID=572511 RepID=UPI000BA32E13|nr:MULTISPECIES: uroporphyrinogen decarboxylase family protein [Blautia]
MSRKDDLLKVWTEHSNIGYIPCVFTDANFLRHPECVNERPEGHDGYDWFGVHWTYQPETNSPMVSPGYPPIITDITKWEEQVKFPDLSVYDWETSAREETKDWDRENKYSEVMIINGCFERSHHLLGFEEALIAMYEEPEAYQALLDRIADYKCELIGIVAKYYKPDIIMMHDDYGANDRMLMSPDTWRQFIKGPLSRLVDTAHKSGMIYEHHSCGHIEPIIGDMIEIGIDALNPLQRPCNDIEKIKKEYGGKITLVGGFSSQTVIENPNSTIEDITSDIDYAYQTLAPGGGYVSFPVVLNMGAFAPKLVKEHLKLAKKFANT